jgi:hypothetical protein
MQRQIPTCFSMPTKNRQKYQRANKRTERDEKRKKGKHLKTWTYTESKQRCVITLTLKNEKHESFFALKL